jgi:hypothetical protein
VIDFCNDSICDVFAEEFSTEKSLSAVKFDKNSENGKIASLSRPKIGAAHIAPM